MIMKQKTMDFIKELAEKLSKQSNRWTQDVAFMGMDKEKEYDGATCYDYDGRERRENAEDYDLCDSCRRIYDDTWEIPEECDDCDENTYDYYNEVWKIMDRPWMFLTSEACDEHIKSNQHHYTNEAKSYWIHLQRNYEMKELIQSIFDIAWVEKPWHYSDVD